MYTRRKLRLGLILRFSWPHLLGFAAWSGLITLGYVLGLDVRLPFLPLSTMGIAVSFYLGFKNNQSYERFWEARKIWGGIVNTSRLLGSQVCIYVASQSEAIILTQANLHALHQEFIYRHLAWLNLLRLQLRRSTPYSRTNASYKPRLPELSASAQAAEIALFLAAAEYSAVSRTANPAAQLLHQQSIAIKEAESRGLLSGFQYVDLIQTIKECYSLQGMCERIKNTPFPRQYAYFSTLFVWIFATLIPFGLLSEFGQFRFGGAVWLTVPFSTLVAWVFITIDFVGDNSEDPFEHNLNDVPMTAICRTIEIDLREMLGETALPASMQPVNDILL
ncbi:MAG: bestrophin family protein [Janthinobacterium lividum]